jgi:hypothetical protein
VIELVRHLDGCGISVGAAFEKDEERWAESLLQHETGRIYVPRTKAPDEALMSRFLAKVAVECLALRFMQSDGHAQSVVSEAALDGLRSYARKGPSKPIWPFNRRSLYPADFTFGQHSNEPYEVLHEWTFIRVQEEDLHFVLALFGVEYAINLGQRSTDAYRIWLEEDPERSPLYPDGIGGS